MSCFERTVLGVGKRSLTFARSFLKKRGAVDEGRANFAGEMGTYAGVVPLVDIRKIGAEPGGVLARWCTMNENNVPVFAERS